MDLLSQIVEDINRKHRDRITHFSTIDFFTQLSTLPPTHPKKILSKIGQDFFLITECKKASPSKGILCSDYDPVRIAKNYEAGGASAISILTEENHFQGNPLHLQAVRKAVSLPLLWKDFVIHEEQVAQARILGADLLLLIFRILSEAKIHSLLDFTLKCGLLPLVEVFSGDNPQKIIEVMEGYSEQCLIGINNRDLKTFNTDISNSEKMYQDLSPLHKNFFFISESGIKTHQDIERVKGIGFNGALVGESLIKHMDPGLAVKQLIGK